MSNNQLLREFTYNPKTGMVCRKGKPCKQTTNVGGYLRVFFGGKNYYQHRVAFHLMTGRWAKEIDHINGDKSDNRWCNLREVSRSQNSMNKKSMNITRRPTNLWQVRVHKNGVSAVDKSFKCFGQAVNLARWAKKEFHGEYAR